MRIGKLWFLLPVLLFLVGCSHSVDITLDNNDPDGWPMYMSVDGTQYYVSVSGSAVHTVTWTGMSDTKTISLEARYVSHGGLATRSLEIDDSKAYTWTVNCCPGYF